MRHIVCVLERDGKEERRDDDDNAEEDKGIDYLRSRYWNGHTAQYPQEQVTLKLERVRHRTRAPFFKCRRGPFLQCLQLRGGKPFAFHLEGWDVPAKGTLGM